MLAADVCEQTVSAIEWCHQTPLTKRMILKRLLREEKLNKLCELPFANSKPPVLTCRFGLTSKH